MEKFIRIGVDLGKNHLQIYALDSEDGRALTRKLRRQGARQFFSGVEPCLIGMEACGSSHYWAREHAAIGVEVRLIPPISRTMKRPWPHRAARRQRPSRDRLARWRETVPGPAALAARGDALIRICSRAEPSDRSRGETRDDISFAF